MPSPPSLFVIQGRDQGTKFQLEEGSTGIGRDSANAVQLHDTEVSRRHADIRRQGGALVLSDLESSNGTYVTVQGETEIVLRREELLLRTQGQVSFGHAYQDDPTEILAFSCLD